MLVEPAPIRPGRRGTPLRIAALVAIVPILVASVVGAALLGGPPSGDPGELAGPASSPGSRPSGEPASPAPRVPSTSPTPPAYPDEAHGIPVLTVAGTLAARAGDRADDLLAVAGWMTMLEADPGCRTSGGAPARVGVFCLRRAVVAATPSRLYVSGGAFGLAELGPHLHALLPPGIQAPTIAPSSIPHGRRVPMPVVVLGRFDDPRGDCGSAGTACGNGFTIEQVAWSAGDWQEPGRSIDPVLAPGIAGIAPGTMTLTDRERRLAVRRALPGAGPVLSESKLAPGSLERIDPAIAAGLDLVPGRPLWYVRVLIRPGRGGLGGPDRTPSVAAVLVDDRTGAVLAMTRG